MRKPLNISVAFFLICMTSLSAAELYKCPESPVIDGKMDKLWEKSFEYQLKPYIKNATVQNGSAARIVYDDKAVYILVRCSEPNLVEARSQEKFAKHDEKVWDNDCIEMFFDVKRDNKEYFQFVVDIHNGSADFLYNAPEWQRSALDWNGNWQHAVGADADSWTVEVAIPWSTLKLPPGDKRSIGMNISRIRNISPIERTVLNETVALHDIQNFLQMENITIEKPLLAGEIRQEKCFFGKNKLLFRFRNDSAEDLAGKLELKGVIGDGTELFARSIPAEINRHSEKDFTFEYKVDQAGLIKLSVTFVDNKGNRGILDSKHLVSRQPLELTDMQPLVEAGRDHPVYLRIFLDAPRKDVQVAIYDGSAKKLAETFYRNIKDNSFVLLPSKELPPGDYTAKITLQNSGAENTVAIPLKVINRL